MPFDIKHEPLFQSVYNLKYITNWNQKFESSAGSGELLFYPGNPQYLVNVSIWADRGIMDENDIEISCGDLHCSSKIKDIIEEKKDIIFEICRTTTYPYFVLDLDVMQVVEPEDFISSLPKRGLNTLFRFANDKPYSYYCLVNTTKLMSDKDFLSWLLSYVYSSKVCLTPLYKPDITAKQFLQAISCLAVYKGDKKHMYVTTSQSVLDSPLNNIGDYDIEVPGNKTDRFKQLLEKSILQMKPHKKGK